MIETSKTFAEIFKSFRDSSNQDSFTAACSAFLNFENNNTSTRLAILYILYAYYSHEPLDHNPFLTFFLQIVEELPSNCIEFRFIYCIFEKNVSTLDNVMPQEVSIDQLPPITLEPAQIDSLKLKVARLIDDPDIVIINQQVMDLLTQASTRILTLSEIEILKDERLVDYPASQCITPSQLPSLINYNQFLAIDIVPILLRTNYASLYLQSILNTTITTNTVETMHHILVNQKIPLSQEFIHYFISNSIRSCDQLEEGSKRDRQVKQVARFIQSLLENQVISMADYFIEIQSFCVSYMKLKGVTNLYRLASNEAQHQILLNQQGTSSK